MFINIKMIISDYTDSHIWFELFCTEKVIKRLRLLEDLRDEIIANYEKRHSKPAIGAMCENDLNLLKQWSWNR